MAIETTIDLDVGGRLPTRHKIHIDDARCSLQLVEDGAPATEIAVVELVGA